MSAASRRETLRRAALAGGALATLGLPALARAPHAAAQASADDEELRDFLEPAIEQAQTAALAFEEAARAKGIGAATKRILEHLGGQEQTHADALASALDSLGFDPPDAPSDPKAVDELRPLAKAASERKTLELLVELTEEQLRLYFEEGAALETADILRTCLEIAANEAQHLVVLRQALGASRAEAVELPRGGESSGDAGD